MKQRGKILFEGRKATQFWVRTFNLESEIEQVKAMMLQKPERAKAAVPIIAEYDVDELKFIFIIQAEVDALGIQNGAGMVYWATPEFQKEALEIRDKHADDLLKTLEESGKFQEIIEMERKREL